MSSRLLLAWLLVASIILGLPPRPAIASPATTERVSVDTAGQEANAYSSYPAISDDGRYVAFLSGASNLVPGDTNGFDDVFVRDRQTGQTRRVSVSSDGTQGDSYTVGGYIPRLAISNNGRVAFTSQARNLVPGDTNLMPDVFIHDIGTGQTTRVSVGEDGRQLTGSSELVNMSPEGRYVTFRNESEGLMMRDVVIGKTEIGVRREWEFFSISDDGRYVAVRSSADDIVPNDNNGMPDIFVHDLQTNVIKSPTVAIQRAWGPILQDPVISGNGRYIVFSLPLSEATAPEMKFGLFVYDLITEKTEMPISADRPLHDPGDTLSQHAISFDGRYVAFSSGNPNLVPGDTNGSGDVFVHDRGPQPEAPPAPPFEPPAPSPSPDSTSTARPTSCESPTPAGSPSPSEAFPSETERSASPRGRGEMRVTASPSPPSPEESGQARAASPTPSPIPSDSPQPTPCTDPPADEIKAEEETSLDIGRLAGLSTLAGAAIGVSALAITWRARRRR